jgi:hypothetical protein
MSTETAADTRMMTIVHEALRRDVRRAHVALTDWPPPPPAQQRAIAGHLAWMMAFLRAHHWSEDEGLYPLVRERAPEAGDLLDTMEADHRAIASTVDQLEAAAGGLAEGDEGAPARVLAALDELDRVLLPHLRREEDEVMPVVSSVVTMREWQAVEQRYNLDPKSFVELGREGHWLIDDASPEDRATVLGLVPAVPRFLLVHGFAGSYRRRAAACWGPPPKDRRVQKRGRCTVEVDADLDAVWAVVTDVTRVGEWSHECVSVRWVGPATTAEPGARFRGQNRAGAFRWGRVCEIVAAAPYELVWRTVPTALFPDSSEWRVRLTAVPGGTRIEQGFTVVRAPKLLDAVYARLIPAHRDRTAALTDDLRRLAEVAGRPAATGAPQRATA